MKKHILIIVSLFFTFLATAQKQHGGFLLEKKELLEILDSNSDYTGLIFVLKSYESVDLHILAVKWNNLELTDKYEEDLIKVKYKKCISLKTGEITDDFTKFEYKFNEQARLSKFKLAFATRDQIEQISEITDNKVLLSGMAFSGGNLMNSDDIFFTLKLQPFGLKERINFVSTGLPGFQILVPCPPMWVNEGNIESVKQVIIKGIQDDLDNFSGDFLEKESNIVLQWSINSTSPGSIFEIYRSSELEKFSLIAKVNANTCVDNCYYIDETVERDQDYQYRIQVILKDNLIENTISSKVHQVFTGY